jgi:hypothetical protein
MSGQGERGIALLASVLILALLAAVTAATLWVTRSELWVAGSARSYLQARYSAEAGVWHALALLAPGTDFAALLAGTGGVSDPATPGPLPLPGGGWVAFPGPPFGYAVAVAAEAGDRVRLRSSATAVRGAQRTVVATVGRAPEPYAPAALVVASGEVVVEGGVGGVVLDARDPADGGQAVVAAATDEAAAAARTSLAAAGASLLGGAPPARARSFDVAAFALATGVAEDSPAVLASVHGAPGAPAALVVAGGIAPRLVGHGAVFARGALELQGDVDWHGVLYVAGELRVAATSCTVAGMVWAERIVFASGCTLRFDAAGVATADQAEPLPRRPTLLALDDA